MFPKIWLISQELQRNSVDLNIHVISDEDPEAGLCDSLFSLKNELIKNT